MSFGKKKMHEMCDKLAPNVLSCDHRGMQWIVVTEKLVHFGTENVEGTSKERKTTAHELPLEFKPWFKKLHKDWANQQHQKEARNVEA